MPDVSGHVPAQHVDERAPLLLCGRIVKNRTVELVGIALTSASSCDGVGYDSALHDKIRGQAAVFAVRTDTFVHTSSHHVAVNSAVNDHTCCEIHSEIVQGVGNYLFSRYYRLCNLLRCGTSKHLNRSIQACPFGDQTSPQDKYVAICRYVPSGIISMLPMLCGINAHRIDDRISGQHHGFVFQDLDDYWFSRIR